MTKLSLVAAGLVLGLSASAVRAEIYPWDLPAGSPALKAWKMVVPKAFERERWFVTLNGTGGPLEETTLHGRPFWSVWVCKPHDCGNNMLVVLLARDGSEAFGLFRAERNGERRMTVIGSPDREARVLLDALMKDQD